MSSTPSKPQEAPTLAETAAPVVDWETTPAGNATPQPDTPSQDQEPAGQVTETWVELKKQQSEFEQHSHKLEVLRGRLEQYLARQNQILLERKRKLETRKTATPESAGPGTGPPPQASLGIYDDDPDWQHEQALSNAVVDGYKLKIGALEREKEDIERRLKVLQLKADRKESTQPGALTNPDWRFGVSLLTALVAGAVLILTTDFSYRIQTWINLDPARIPPVMAEACVQDLEQVLGEDHTVLSDSLLVYPPRVKHEPRAHRVDLTVTTRDKTAGESWLAATTGQFLERQEDARRMALQLAEQRLRDIEQGLLTTSEAHQHLVTRLAEKQQVLLNQNPRSTLQELQAKLMPARQEYDEIQAEIVARDKEMKMLESTEIPELPEVDLQTRLAAEDNDEYLREDLEALKVRLTQLHSYLLEGFEQSSGPLENYYAAASGLRSFLDTQRLNLDDARLVSELDQLIKQANSLLQLVSDFEKKWKQYSEDLSHLTVDPRQRGTLQIQRQVEELVRNFHYETNLVLKELQLQYQSLGRNLEGQPELFQLQNGLATQNRQLVKEQLAFSDYMKRFLVQGDFQLDAIVHSAEGFSRRVRDREATIENELSTARHDALLREKKRRMSEITDRLSNLHNRREAVLQLILKLHEDVSELVPSLEAHSAAEVQVKYEKIEEQELVERLEAQRRLKEDYRNQITTLQNAQGGMQLRSVQASSWPVNTVDRLSKIGFGSLATLIGVFFLLNSLTGRARPAAKPGTANGP